MSVYSAGLALAPYVSSVETHKSPDASQGRTGRIAAFASPAKRRAELAANASTALIAFLVLVVIIGVDAMVNGLQNMHLTKME